jgi:hypothetical protein
MHLTTKQLDTISIAALENYEFSCSWAKAFIAASEYAKEEGLSANRSAIAASVNIAKAKWESLCVSAKEAA